MPANELERAVIARILEFLRSPEEFLNTLRGIDIKARDTDLLLKQANRQASGWRMLTVPEQELYVKAIIQRVVVHRDSIDIRLNAIAMLRAFEVKQTNTLRSEQRETDAPVLQRWKRSEKERLQ